LIHPEYFANYALCKGYPVEELDTSSMNSVDFEAFGAVFEGTIMYELERKHVKPGSQSEPTNILLSISWESEGYKKFSVLVHLIECSKTLHWDKIKLKEYHRRHADQLSPYTDPIKDTWLLPDGTVLTTELELDFTQRDGVLNIIISERNNDNHARRPKWINLNK
jgi:hypothetical protein